MRTRQGMTMFLSAIGLALIKRLHRLLVTVFSFHKSSMYCTTRPIYETSTTQAICDTSNMAIYIRIRQPCTIYPVPSRMFLSDDSKLTEVFPDDFPKMIDFRNFLYPSSYLFRLLMIYFFFSSSSFPSFRLVFPHSVIRTCCSASFPS